jgi:hypothetical protein
MLRYASRVTKEQTKLKLNARASLVLDYNAEMSDLAGQVTSGATTGSQTYGLEWVPVIGLSFTLFCPISEKYFYPFQPLFHYRHIYGIPVGELFFRLLLLAPFVFALILHRRSQNPDVRIYSIAAGMYWPMLISTIIIVSNSGYAITWTWVLPIIHIVVAVHATAAVCRATKARWCWLGVLYGLGAWLISSRT